MKYTIQVKIKKFGWFTAIQTANLNEFKRKKKALLEQGHELRFSKMGVISNVSN